MSDTTFLPGPNLRVARNDSGMSFGETGQNATNETSVKPQAQTAAPAGLPSGCMLLKTTSGLVWRAPDGTDYPYQEAEIPLYLPLRSFEPGVTDKVDPLDPSSYTDDVHTNTDGTKVRVRRARPVPAPKDATLQDRLRKYSPVNGYARYTHMAADRIDQQEKELQACRNLQMELNNKLTAARIEIERRQVAEESLTRAFATMNRLFMEASEGRQQIWDEKFRLEQHLNRLIAPGFFTRIFNAMKGNK